MNRSIEVLQTVLPVLIMLCIGMICRGRTLISREGISALKSVVVNIALPAVLLNAFAATSYSFMDIIIPLMMFLVCLAAWALGHAGRKLFRMPSRFVPFLTTGFEAGMLGYALFNMLYGSSRTAEFARIDLGQVLFVFTLYKILLGMEGHEKADLKQLLKEMAFSPIILAIIAGVILGASGLYRALTPSGISGIFDACTDFVSAPTSAIILLTIGYDLVLKDIPWLSTLKVTVLRFGIMMLLRVVFLGVLKLFFPEAGLGSAVNVMFILPPPFVLPVFADDADQRVYVSSALSVSTVVSIAGFAVLAALGI
jgi:predicted permease